MNVRIKTCEYCGDVFQPYEEDERFCSDECEEQYYYEIDRQETTPI